MELQQLAFVKQYFRAKRQVYLDHNATTAVSGHVLRTMHRVLKHRYGNPSSLYKIARQSAEIIEQARRDAAAAMHAAPHEVYFTGCATESNNAVLKSVSRHFHPGKTRIVSTPIEHPSVTSTLDFLTTQGITVEYCPVDSHGRVDPADIEKLIDDRTFLVCCMLANNETGTVQDIAAITAAAHRRGALVLSDCVQAFGKIPVDVHALGVDYASFSAHKLHGPKGVGALYVRSGGPFTPLLHGGHQEDGMRAGTESIHNIAGFGAACQRIDRLLSRTERTGRLKSRLIGRLRKIKPDCVINSPEEDCLPNTLSVTFPDVSNAELMAALDYHGVAVSAGSACSTQEKRPSHVLKAIGLSDKAAQETIRISLGSDTTGGDIRYAAKVLGEYMDGRLPFVNTMTLSQLNESVLFDRQTYILDVRPQFMRKLLKSLPNSHEASFVSIEKYVHHIPRDKHILVVCQRGNLSHIVAYYLKSKGFPWVTNLRGGICGWDTRCGDLYERFAGRDITALQPA
jgi:cysteine desulfurase